MRTTSALLSFCFVALSACGSSPDARSTRGQSQRSDAPSRPFAAELERPVAVADLEMMLRWVGTRFDEARLGDRRRVRVPLIRRAANLEDDSPEWAIAASPMQGPFYWLALVGNIGAIPTGDWAGWVEGSFTGNEIQYRSRDSAVTMNLPVFEVRSQERRASETPMVQTYPR